MKTAKTLISICLFALLLTTTSLAKKDTYPDANDKVEVDQLPVIKTEVIPEYPRLALLAGIDGTVWVKILVDKKGIVRKAVVEKSSGTTSLDEFALKSAYKSKYSPARKNGRRIAVWITYNVEYIITHPYSMRTDSGGEGESKISNYSLPAENTLINTDSMPVLIKEIIPNYPDSSLSNNISGIIRVKALIDKDGSVVWVKIKSSDESKSELEAETVRASLLFKFQPALYKTKPVAVWINYKVQFSILDADSKKNKIRIIGLNSPSEKYHPRTTTNPDEFITDERYPESDEFIPVEIYPEMITQTQPDYPDDARQAGITGDVMVKVLVDKNGIVIKAMVLVSSGTASLDQAAVKASYNNKFKPAIQNGKPVAVWISYKVSFTLPDEEN